MVEDCVLYWVKLTYSSVAVQPPQRQKAGAEFDKEFPYYSNLAIILENAVCRKIINMKVVQQNVF